MIKKALLFCYLLASTVYTVQAQSYQWRNLPIGGGGYTVGIKIHPANPSLLYVRTDVGGLYRWSAREGKLIQLFGWVSDARSNLYGIAGMALHPTNENIVYSGAGKYAEDQPHGVFRSSDQGRTWKDLHLPVQSPFDVNNGNADHRFGNPVELHPARPHELWVGTVRNGLYIYDEKSAGQKWTRHNAIPSGFSIRSILFDTAYGSSFVYVGLRSKGVYRSADGGKTFSLVPGSEGFTIQDMDLSGSGHQLYLCTEREGVVRLDNAKVGTQWKTISPGGHTEFRGLATSPHRNGLLVTSPKPGNAVQTIYVSTDGGDSWTLTKPGAVGQIFPWHSASFPGAAISQFAFDPDPRYPNRVYFTDWYSVWRTDNLLAPQVLWTNEQGRGHEEVVCLAMTAPPSANGQAYLYTGLADVSGFVHHDLNHMPEARFVINGQLAGGSFQDVTGIDISETNAAFVVLSGENKHAPNTGALAVSTNGGRSFQVAEGYQSGWGFARVAVGASAPGETPAIVAATKSSGVRYSADGGKTWHPSAGAPSSLELGISGGVFRSVYPLAADRVAPQTFYLYHQGNGIVFCSTDGGRSFSPLTHWGASAGNNQKDKAADHASESAGRGVNDRLSIEAAPGKANHLWAALGKQGLYQWNGTETNKMAKVKEAVLMCLGKPAAGSAYPTIFLYGKLAHDSENWIYRSADSGKTWQKINDAANRIGGSPQLMKADRQVYGRVFIGTSGTGVWIGEEKSPTAGKKRENDVPRQERSEEAKNKRKTKAT